MCYAPLLDAELTARLLPYRIQYDAADNMLRFESAYLSKPVVRSYVELVKLLERFPYDLDQPLSKSTPLSEGVGFMLRQSLARHAPTPRANEIAQKFGISVATLKRRLQDEGSGLTELKKACRYGLALDLLRDSNLSIGEIAARLGFSDPTTFARAFHRWNGCSPTAYQRRLQDH
jgi:AraC-like DNA-binding protein